MQIPSFGQHDALCWGIPKPPLAEVLPLGLLSSQVPQWVTESKYQDVGSGDLTGSVVVVVIIIPSSPSSSSLLLLLSNFPKLALFPHWLTAISKIRSFICFFARLSHSPGSTWASKRQGGETFPVWTWGFLAGHEVCPLLSWATSLRGKSLEGW